MSPLRFQLITIAAALVIATPAGARPGLRHGGRRSVSGGKLVEQLSELDGKSKTLCPFVVKLDTQSGRQPADIKTIECIKTGPVTELDAKYSCVQLVDSVPVHYDDMSVNVPINVGCVCIKNDSRQLGSAEAPSIH